MNKPDPKTVMKDGWNKISNSYQRRYDISPDSYYYGPFCPTEDELQLLGEVKGKQILEIGSGAGQNSIYLAKRGAHVIAYDISAEQIRYGKALASKSGVPVEFIVGAFEDLAGTFEPGKFDFVISSFAFQYHQSAEDLRATFAEIYQLLKAGGQAVISVDHPIKAIGYWTDDNQFILGNYFDDSTKTWDYEFPETRIAAPMVGRYFMISEYLNAIHEAGLILDLVLEPKATQSQESTNNFGKRSLHGDESSKDPFAFDHLTRIPGTLILKASKPI